MNKVIIGAPFGNYLNFNNTTSTLGTFTWYHRGGLWYRLWRMLRTLRYNRKIQGWMNKLGLPNPGLRSLGYGQCVFDKIISIYGFNRYEWINLAQYLELLGNVEAVELNLSCPNTDHDVFIEEVLHCLPILQRSGIKIITKLPPIKWMKFAEPLYDKGIHVFHCCNTIPSPNGGISGKVLKQYSLWAIEELRKKFGETVTLIGGGGITTKEDVKEYKNAGANHIALASMLFNPFNWAKIPSIVNEMVNGH